MQYKLLGGKFFKPIKKTKFKQPSPKFKCLPFSQLRKNCEAWVFGIIWQKTFACLVNIPALFATPNHTGTTLQQNNIGETTIAVTTREES